MVLGVNIHPPEDEYVLPFMKGNKYGFIPLKVPTAEWAEEIYKVRGTPANFLIGPDGRLYFKPRVHSPESQRTLELLVESLLAQVR